MVQQRLNSLAVCHVYQLEVLDLVDVGALIKEFNSRNILFYLFI
jgi:hypothetical protein